MRVFRHLALALFAIYVVLLPGSIVVVALDRVPAWGDWMGGVLLMLQGLAVLCWLIGFQRRRGALAGAAVFTMAWALEHVGVTTGFPFGRYHYTGVLQPQLLGVVPLAIACAWLMVAIGAWQLATADDRRRTNDHGMPPSLIPRPWSLIGTATLILLLDLQIETVATKVNHYWIWLDGGLYYDVPTANFVAWWLVGLAMALVVSRLLPATTGDRRPAIAGRQRRFSVQRSAFSVQRSLPATLYLLSTAMFAAVNLARGYTIAGLIGVAALLIVGGPALRLHLAPYGRFTTKTRRREDEGVGGV